jgi:predicted nucleic acid-binding protein
VILVDTGPLVAAALAGDVNHMRCVELFTSVHLAGELLAVPSLVVTEACYLIAREAGPKVEAEFV